MRTRFGGSTIATTVGAAVVLLAMAAMRPQGQAATDRAPRIQGKPNLSGIWQAVKNTPAMKAIGAINGARCEGARVRRGRGLGGKRRERRRQTCDR